jgi:hypothetical protein
VEKHHGGSVPRIDDAVSTAVQFDVAEETLSEKLFPE